MRGILGEKGILLLVLPPERTEECKTLMVGRRELVNRVVNHSPPSQAGHRGWFSASRVPPMAGQKFSSALHPRLDSQGFRAERSKLVPLFDDDIKMIS